MMYTLLVDQDIAIGGWTLKHTAGEQETVFKFHRSAKIAAKASVTVSGSIHIYSLPSAQWGSDRTSPIGGAAMQASSRVVKSCVIPWRDIARLNILF